MQAAIIRLAAIVVLILLIAGYGLWQRGSKESAYRALDTAQAEARGLRSELAAEQERRSAEKATAAGQKAATDAADTREQGIDDEYEERIAAAVAGRDRDIERLRKQWGQCATAGLSAGAAIAGESGAQDQLRRTDIAAVLRDASLLQSERDEAVDLYEVVYNRLNQP